MGADYWKESYKYAIIEGVKITNEIFRPYYKYILLFILIRIFFLLLDKYDKRKLRRKIYSLVNQKAELTPEEFFKVRNKSFGGKGKPLYSNNYHFTGVYILHNKTKDLYYVGQSKNIFNRINHHFTGKGNGDLYADYKYKDKFTIRAIALNGSGYDSIDDLERHAIETYNAYEKGYNKNRGNGN